MATGTAVDVVMPQMGVSVSEGTITKWLKQVGDTIEADETLLEISTDKVDTEVPSPASGVVSEILVQEGETVDVGTVLARIGGEAGGPGAPGPAPSEAPPEPATPGSRRRGSRVRRAEACARRPRRSEPLAPPTEPAPRRTPATAAPATASFVSPVVARIAAEHGVDPSQVAGHRPRRPRDEEGHPGLHRRSGAAAAARRGSAPRPAPTPAAPPPAAPPAPPRPRRQRRPVPRRRRASSAPGESFEPMTAMRRGIADHMRRSLDTSAHVTSAIEVDMSKVVAIREKLKKEYAGRVRRQPDLPRFIARATIDTLRDWPWVNAELRGASIVTKSFVNLGFAVALEGGKGLIVPVLKNAEG